MGVDVIIFFSYEVIVGRVPGINIATDIICGFPTESEEVKFL